MGNQALNEEKEIRCKDCQKWFYKNRDEHDYKMIFATSRCSCCFDCDKWINNLV